MSICGREKAGRAEASPPRQAKPFARLGNKSYQNTITFAQTLISSPEIPHKHKFNTVFRPSFFFHSLRQHTKPDTIEKMSDLGTLHNMKGEEKNSGITTEGGKGRYDDQQKICSQTQKHYAALKGLQAFNIGILSHVPLQGSSRTFRGPSFLRG